MLEYFNLKLTVRLQKKLSKKEVFVVPNYFLVFVNSSIYMYSILKGLKNVAKIVCLYINAPVRG